MDPIRFLAIYLPQFYPIPENDRWWGRGFTEWTNAAKARPLFKGHYQPHLPADLGFYDLRVPDTLHAQADLARSSGLNGFCFYHYWFNGKRVLEKPLDLYVQQSIDFPFCICWANQDWTRTWSGNDGDLLMKQDYSHDDDRAHIRFLAERFFSQPGYVTVDEKPVFVIYRTALFPDIKRTAEIWREEVHKMGLKGIYLIRMETDQERFHPNDINFDATIDFHPHSRNLPQRVKYNRIRRALSKYGIYDSASIKNYIFDYQEYVNLNRFNGDFAYPRYPSLFPMWDNSARKEKNAWIFTGSTPSLFQKWLDQILTDFSPPARDENFIFINAWNEWAEGNHLEPCQKWGRAYLDVIQKKELKAAVSKIQIQKKIRIE